jgi:DNA repair protein RadC
MAKRAQSVGAQDIAVDDAAFALDKPHYLGHRERLRQRFLEVGADALQDYEILELVLFVIPRRDVKPLAKELIRRFGSLEGVVAASLQQLKQVPGLDEAGIAALKAIEHAVRRLTKARIMKRPVLSSWEAVLDYCSAAMARSPVEEFRILFLDRKNGLIDEEVHQHGTVDHTPVYPREVVKRALELGASALILVHNHPSGDPTPSRADIAITREIVAAAGALKIDVHDHLVIGHGRHASFKALGLL